MGGSHAINGSIKLDQKIIKYVASALKKIPLYTF